MLLRKFFALGQGIAVTFGHKSITRQVMVNR